MKQEHLLSVIVPAYKQEKTIQHDLQRIKKVLDQLRYPSELICVVDGKLDKTFENASKLSQKDPSVKVVGYEHNKGKGHAVRFGMAQSKGDIVAFIDAGADINPNGLSMLLEHFEWYNADIVVGSKRHPASKVNYTWQRKILSMGYQLVTRILFGLKVKDTQVGIKFYRRDVLEKVLPRLIVKRFAFDIEILAVAYYLGFKRMYEAPVELHLEFGKGSSITDKKFIKTVYLMLWDTLAVFYRLRILRYYSDENQRKWRYDPELNFRVNLP
jgi:glycosyltransferase involved in cell wall biosynthesis